MVRGMGLKCNEKEFKTVMSLSGMDTISLLIMAYEEEVLR